MRSCVRKIGVEVRRTAERMFTAPKVINTNIRIASKVPHLGTLSFIATGSGSYVVVKDGTNAIFL